MENNILAHSLSTAETYLSYLDHGTRLQLIGNPRLLYAKSGSLEVYYAPFDHIALGAKLVVVGITPGLTQALNAFEAARGPLRAGRNLPEVLHRAKLAASFSGAMRGNLVAMLDAIGVADLFALRSTSALFTEASEYVHFTSALRYPVFVNGANYNGTPDMLRTPVLRRMVETCLAEEAAALQDSLWLPLGPKAEAAVLHLTQMGLLDRQRVIAGMPHPSGANAERVSVFLGRKDPALASRQTNPAPLLQARASLSRQIADLKGASA